MKLRTYPDPILLKRSAPVEAFDDEFRQKIAEMWDIMYEEGGVGLAAAQVGWSVRVLLLNPSGTRDDTTEERVVINPKVLKSWGRSKSEEGCLSFPDITVDVTRKAGLRLSWQDESGETLEEDINDFPARIIQHEMDHLEGVLLVHRMSPVDRIRYRRELEELVASLVTE
jgi:peptide deformylase